MPNRWLNGLRDKYLNMSGILNFFRENPVLGIILAISLLLLNIGIWILRNPAPLPIDHTGSGQEQLALEIPALPDLGEEGQNIENFESTLKAFTAGALSEASQLSPQQLDKAIADAEKGSELWCDLLLVKADSAWTEEESVLFAKECI